MNNNRRTLLLMLAIIAVVLVVDQVVKVWIKTHLTYGEEFLILGQDWARIHFVENNGMAFGIDFGGAYGKLFLSLFRIAAVIALFYYLTLLIRDRARVGFLVSFALILAGAIGNIIDSTFYGVIFSESTFHGAPAVLFPEGGGYSSLLHGKVVDMFYFPMFEFYVPDWVPFFGGDDFLFFRPVFNVADAAITTGVFSILLFHRDYFSSKPTPKEPDAVPDAQAPTADAPATDAPADTPAIGTSADTDSSAAPDAARPS